MVDDYTLVKVLDKIEKIGIKKLYDTKTLIDADDKLPDDISLKFTVILMTYVIKDCDKFYLKIF